MKKTKQFKTLVQKTFAIAMAAALIGGLASILYADEPKSDATPEKTDSTPPQTNSVETKAVSPDADQVAAKDLLTGAELYSIHCNRCHPERYPTERTAAQWKTIMLHMQVRANIPGSQARMILKYLQDNSGR
jgi:cytochrome c5